MCYVRKNISIFLFIHLLKHANIFADDYFYLLYNTAYAITNF